MPATAIAKTVNGRITRVSLIRNVIHSSRGPSHADASPDGTPSTAPMRTASRAPSTDSRVPAISRLSTSRPT